MFGFILPSPPTLVEDPIDAVLAKVEAQAPSACVFQWRVEQFGSLGFCPEEAELLADSANADLGLARQLQRDGCPAETALRILL